MSILIVWTTAFHIWFWVVMACPTSSGTVNQAILPLGNTLAFATYDGTAWTALQTLTGTLGFGREPHAVVNTDGSLLVVWVHADADGWTMASDPNAVVEAYRDGDPLGSAPGRHVVAARHAYRRPGDYHHLRLEALPSGAIWATRLETVARTPRCMPRVGMEPPGPQPRS